MAKSKTKRKIGNFHNSLDGIICQVKLVSRTSAVKLKKAPRLQIITRSRRKSCPTLRHYDRNATLGPVVNTNRPKTRKFSESDNFGEKMEFDEQTDEDDGIHGTMWEVLPSLALIRIFDKLKRSERYFLVYLWISCVYSILDR